MTFSSSSQEIPRLTEHLFRQEAGKLVSALTGLFGMARLQLAEDVVQEAMIRALQTWPYHGIPENPAAWLMQTARNRALDIIRREKSFHTKQPAIIATLENWSGDSSVDSQPRFDDEIKDDRLRLIFACCHPLVSQDDQSALALKTLCGFSPGEIAKAYITSEAAIAKRLTRARQKIRDLGIPFEIPSGPDLAPRLESVLHVLYLLFNEGYKASSGDNLIREDLCAEAIGLTTLLADHPATSQPRTHALLALMLLNAARLPGRLDPQGGLLRLADQDRGTWHRPMIAQGLHHLTLSAEGDSLSEYHLQAIIAASHATAGDDASTDWPGILNRYDQWLGINDSPIIALNRAVAVAKVRGPAAGIEAVEAIRNRKPLENYYLIHAVLGEFEAQLGNYQTAVRHLQKALDLAEVKSEQSFLLKQLQGYEAHPS
ncbi:sigma-70 family RNA polymerase sigma factor [Luteolibacter yonseiensis]|uniref:Sigma-70 family RNA polymerase sigma factor n=1 Tax=Luteolibacter yonseiensis TaxID=1144680 RepID=A0A934R5Q4_9BACT|nr:sigma-70 family RNA polymerase sigma factor [Luteolibacter yonseiensis]MBK1816872.1 sigma-70 family RNA polymerase sigma factor [Luteolibacter yonseiensis]